MESCLLHTCSNSFLKWLKVPTWESDIDFDQFFIDLFGFFKLSAKRIKDYFEVETFTDLQGGRMIKHVSTYVSTSLGSFLQKKDLMENKELVQAINTNRVRKP